MKMCIFRSVDNNQSRDGTNEWIQKVKRWSAFTLKRVRKVSIHLCHRRINIVVHTGKTEKIIFHLSYSVYLMSQTNGCNTFCMLFQNKSTPPFLLMESIPLFKKFFYCEIFAGSEDARLHTV